MDDRTHIEVFVTPGLGDNSYVLLSGDEAVLVDPQRDVWRMLAAAEGRGARVRYVLETHVHNDYVSGAAEARAATATQVAGPADGGFSFPFVPMEEGAELTVGDLRLQAVRTPGHTPEHTSYAVLAPGQERPSAVFSGGSLIAGSAGRTDLLGEDRAEELTRAQFRTMRRFEDLPDATLLLPTHGAGSFCASGPPEEDRTSTIGRERVRNLALRETDEETFVRQQLTRSLGPRLPKRGQHIVQGRRGAAPHLGQTVGPPLQPHLGQHRLGRLERRAGDLKIQRIQCDKRRTAFRCRDQHRAEAVGILLPQDLGAGLKRHAPTTRASSASRAAS